MQTWRLFSSAFVHADLIHAYRNMTALSRTGPFVEHIFNSPRFLAIYFTSAVFGGLASWMSGSCRSLGASGAIYGLYGTLTHSSPGVGRSYYLLHRT